MERSQKLSMDEAFLQKLTDAVFANLNNEQFSAEDLATEVGLSRSQIHRKLHKINGKSITQFIREIRLDEAHKLLEADVATSAEVAYQVGFSSPAYFSECFHEYFGYTPGNAKSKKKEILKSGSGEDDPTIIPIHGEDTFISGIHKLKANQEKRRLAAVMFTDIVGYTALMGSDEDRALEVLAKNREIHSKLIDQYRGTLIKEMGDGMLISFGLASEAVRCAIEIQKACKSHGIPLKIGIHEGEMVFDGGDVLGDGVNIASRIQDDTDGGCIMISGSVYRDIKNKADIHTEFVEEKKFKNVDEKIKVFRVNCGDEADDNSNHKNQNSNLPRQAGKYQLSNTKKGRAVFTTIGFFVIIIMVVLVWQFGGWHKTSPPLPDISEVKDKSIAVRPFWNESTNLENEAFVIGIAEDIRNNLSKIAGLRVTSRGSVEKYRDSEYTNKEICDELNVSYVLEGTAQRMGNQVKIHVQLILGENEDHIWEDTYLEDISDIQEVFNIQSKIAQSVANELKVFITDEEKTRIELVPTHNKKAYDFYVKGRYYWNKRTEKDLLHSLELFGKSIELDSSFALAWSGLADTYLMLSGYGHFPFRESNTNAKSAIKKALAIDPNLAEAHTTLGWLYAFDNHDWGKSEESFEKALRFKPSYSVAHSWYAWTLAVNGKTKLSESHIQTARSLDPLSDIINASTGWVTYINGNFAEAKKHFKSAISLNAEFPRYYFWLGHTYMASEQYDSAIIYLKKALELENESPQYLSCLIFCQGRAKNNFEAELTYNKLYSLANKRFISNYDLALAQLGIGDVEGAINFLMKAYDDRDIWITFLAVDPRFNYLHERQDFQKIVKKMGINTSWMQ